MEFFTYTLLIGCIIFLVFGCVVPLIKSACDTPDQDAFNQGYEAGFKAGNRSLTTELMDELRKEITEKFEAYDKECSEHHTFHVTLKR